MAVDLAVTRVDDESLRLSQRLGALPPVGFALAAVTAVGAAGGGYFPASWGWSAVAFAWLAGVALSLRTAIRLSRPELLFAGGLAVFAVWTLASSLWIDSATPVREAQRAVVYVLAVLAALLVSRTRAYRGLVGGAWAAIALLCLYALATRLFPDRLGEFDSLADYRLSEPLGYWNGLGILAAIGSVLALGLAARARNAVVAAVAAASIALFLPVIYFTFGRGAWVALAGGLVFVVALDPRRLQFATTTFALAPAAGFALFFSSRADALSVRGSTFGAATEDGHRLAVLLLLPAALAVAASLGLHVLRNLRVPPTLRTAYGASLLVVAAATVGAVLIAHGGPVALAERGYDALETPNRPGRGAQDLSERLFTVSSPGRVDQWRIAWDQYREHPVLGAGAGSYERYWLRHRPNPGVVRDAHSLYLETLAELGPLGLALLLGALAVPLTIAVRARRRALVPAAAGAYVAYLAHAAVDWDWELPAVTLAAVVCASAILVAGRPRQISPLSTRLRWSLLAATVALGAFAFVGLMGNQALAAGKDAEENEELVHAESEARKATRWAPWAPEPWKLLADVHFERNDLPSARAALLRALEKDRGDWAIWFDLGVASTGREKQRAYEEAARLNPRSTNVEVLRILDVLPQLPSGRR